MPFYGPSYEDDFHASYTRSPYARPVSIEVLEGGEGFDTTAAVANLRAKRLPWEIDPELRRAELIRGGALFPAGVYRCTMEDVVKAVDAMRGLPYFAFPWLTWIYAAERRPHYHGPQDYAPFSWAPFGAYNHSVLDTTSVGVAAWMGAMNDIADWEGQGHRVTFRLTQPIKIVAIASRQTFHWEAAYMGDPNAFIQDAVNVNGFVFKQGAGEGWGIWANDAPH